MIYFEIHFDQFDILYLIDSLAIFRNFDCFDTFLLPFSNMISVTQSCQHRHRVPQV